MLVLCGRRDSCSLSFAPGCALLIVDLLVMPAREQLQLHKAPIHGDGEKEKGYI